MSLQWEIRQFDQQGFNSIMQLAFGSLVIAIVSHSKICFFASCFLCCFGYTVRTGTIPPINNPAIFREWVKKQCKRQTTLLCIGDSLTHGHLSANFALTEIPLKFINVLEPTKATKSLTISTASPFIDPIWVVNAGQNGATTFSYLQERLIQAWHGVCPDYVLLLLGTNDVLCMSNDDMQQRIRMANMIPADEPINMETFERNFKAIINFILQQPSSPKVALGVCTLPPIGEDLNSRYNILVRQANQIIEKIVLESGNRTSLIPVYATMVALLDKEKRSNVMSLNFNTLTILFIFINLMNRLFSMSWNVLSKIGGYTLTNDGIHFNEFGRDIFVDLIVDWLTEKKEKVLQPRSPYVETNHSLFA